MVEEAEDDFVGVAEDGTTISLTAQEIVIYDVDRVALSRAICAALDITPNTTDDSDDKTAWLIGSFEQRGITHPVYFLAAAEDDEFSEVLARLVIVNTSPFMVLTPTQRRLGRALRDRLASSGGCTVALSEVVAVLDDGTIVPINHPGQLLSGAARIAGRHPERPDGFYPPNQIVFRGHGFTCSATKKQMAFLSVGLVKAEIPIDELMRRRTGVIWQEQFTDEKRCHDKIHQFCTRLNGALVNARTGISFSFNAATRYVQRRDPVWATDNSLTKD